MKYTRHICLELLLYMIILMEAKETKDDEEPKNKVDTTFREVTYLWKTSCASVCPYKIDLNAEYGKNVVCNRKSQSKGMESLRNFSISLFWNTSVIIDEEECIISLKSYCVLDKKNKSNRICNNKNVSEKRICRGCCKEENEDRHKRTMCPNAKTSDDETTENDNSSLDEEKKENEMENDENGKDNKQKKKGKKKCKEKMPQGILVLTHFVAAAIGAGSLYFALFLKKNKRTLNDKNKEEGKKGISNASYNLQKGSTENMRVPCFSHHDEGVYCEVAEKPRSLPSHTNFSYSLADDSALESRKNTRLPDIPQQTKKNNDLYLTPISRSLPHEYLVSSGKAITESYAMDENEQRWTNDSKSEINVMNEADRLKDTLDTELSEQYFVLEKGSDMDLK